MKTIIKLPERRYQCCGKGSDQNDVVDEEEVEVAGGEVVEPVHHEHMIDEASQTHQETENAVHKQDYKEVLLNIEVFYDVDQNP